MAQLESFVGEGPPIASLRRRTVRGIVITLGAQSLRFALSMGTVGVLARLLSPEAFGLVAMVTAITNLPSLLGSVGLSSAIVQRQRLSDEQASAGFWIGLLFAVALGLLLAAASPLVAAIYGEPRLVPMVLALSFGCVLSALGQLHLALLQRAMHMGTLASIEIGSAVFGAACAIASASAGHGAWALVVQNLAGIGSMSLAAWLFCAWRPGRFRRGVDTGGLLGFGADVTAATLLGYLARNLDNILIGAYAGAGQLGAYSRAYALLMQPLNQINAPVSKVALPLLSRLTAEPERYRSAYLSIVRLIGLVAMPLVAFMAATAEPLVLLLLGEGWGESARIYAVLAVVGSVQVIGNTCGWLFVSQGRGPEMRNWSVIGALLASVSFVIGLPWGAFGVAAAYAAICLLVTMPWLFWFVGRRGPVTTGALLRSLLLPGLVSALVFAVSAAAVRWQPTGVPVLLWSALIAAIAWTIAVAAIPEARSALRHARSLLAGAMR